MRRSDGGTYLSYDLRHGVVRRQCAGLPLLRGPLRLKLGSRGLLATTQVEMPALSCVVGWPIVGVSKVDAKPFSNNFQTTVTWLIRCAPAQTSMFGSGDSGVDFKAFACSRLDFRHAYVPFVLFNKPLTRIHNDCSSIRNHLCGAHDLPVMYQ